MGAHDLGHGDEDSLFGSPPSSPARGRSPPLALPSGNTSQNVGTIALPGSHNCSEPSVHPLASSWRVAPQEPPRPPAHPTLVNGPACAAQQLETASQSSSRASSVTAKKKQKGKQKKPTPTRSHPPPIPLPDPNAPPPNNFLRNQQALLGMAGLVGGVNLATLSTRRPVPGSTCKNPIVVDDGEGDQPRLGRNIHTAPPIDPTFLALPSQGQIIDSLVKQKNIFPVLESLLKLLTAGGSQHGLPPHTDPECRRQSVEPQKKRRKLSSVPAGAADWDVPYPFPEGEGPTEYRTNWERDRCTQLITQLVSSLKSAARTAATKTYMMQHKLSKDAPSVISNPPPPLHQVSINPECGNSQTTPVPALTETTIVSSISLNPCSTDPESTSISQLDQLFQSQHSQYIPSSHSTNAPLDDIVPEMDPAFYESWKSLLESFNTSDLQQVLGVSTPSVSDSSDALPSHDFVKELSALPVSQANSTPESSSITNFPDFTIDPMILAMSNSSASHLGIDAVTPFVHSLQSNSSVAGPSTPIWEFPSKDSEICDTDPVEQSAAVVDSSLGLSETRPLAIHFPSLDPTTSAQCPALDSDSILPAEPAAEKCTSEPISEESQPPQTLSTPQFTLPLQGPAFSTGNLNPVAALPCAPATSSSRAISGSGRTNTEPRSRDVILRGARERRRQLAAEIERAKVELWEVTIEQAVLTHIAKEKSS